MKTIQKNLILFLLPAILITACGEKQDEKNADSSEPVKKVDAELEKSIDELAACEQQNTNCEAYNKTSEYIQERCNDEKERDAVVADLFTMIENGPSKKSQAAAHAVNFWTYGNFRENSEYGKIVLKTLLKEKTEQGNYTGAQLGQLLAGWYATEDKDLFKGILAAVKSKSTEEYGRMELIRLAPPAALNNSDLFNTMTTIINDANEKKEIRIQALNVIWRVENEELKNTVRTIYEGMITNPEVQIAGASVQGLAYIKSYTSYDLIEKKLLETKDDQNWCYYGSYALGDLVKDAGENIDMNNVFSLVKTLISNKNVTAYYRSYYVSTLMNMDTAAAKNLLAQLKNSGEKEIVDEINRRMTK